MHEMRCISKHAVGLTPGLTMLQGLAYSVAGGWNTTPADHVGLFVAGGDTAKPAEFLTALRRVLQVRGSSSNLWSVTTDTSALCPWHICVAHSGLWRLLLQWCSVLTTILSSMACTVVILCCWVHNCLHMYSRCCFSQARLQCSMALQAHSTCVACQQQSNWS